MWGIPDKPSLRKAKNDAAKTVEHCRGLDATDEVKLKTLYETYDLKKGRLDAADLVPLDGKKEIIKNQYPKTYGKGELSYIRRQLMKDVDRCPMCSILPPTDLDHFWNQSNFGQLAVCRLNLVPACGICNKKKTNGNPDDFVHAYYQQFPVGVIFLKANCKIVKEYVVPSFSIDGSRLGDATLTRRLVSQMKEVKLKNRLRAASKGFLRELFQGTTFGTERALKAYLSKAEKDKTEVFGPNDWRTALIRGLKACPGMNMSIVLNYRKSTSRTRNGRI